MPSSMITPASLTQYLLNEFEGLSVIDAWGETSFFYNPNSSEPRGTYYCTIKEKDGENDKASALDRENVFRLNFGLSKDTFSKLFGDIPKRPAKGRSIDGPFDFTKLDSLTPHPVYGWMCWVAIVNPSEESFYYVKDLLHESYRLALQKHQKKRKLSKT